MLTSLDPARCDWLVNRWAARIQAAGLVSPAILLLEWHRPLAFMGGQVLLGLQPLIGLLMGEAGARELALFFEQPDNISRLIERLEHPAEPPSEI